MRTACTVNGVFKNGIFKDVYRFPLFDNIGIILPLLFNMLIFNNN
jgi:hypothetical protein